MVVADEEADWASTIAEIMYDLRAQYGFPYLLWSGIYVEVAGMNVYSNRYLTQVFRATITQSCRARAVAMF
jgi:hypothetical protein